MGAKVTGYSLPAPTEPSLFESASVQQGIEHIIGDIRDSNTLSEAINQCQPEIVLHLAAQPLVRYSYDNPVETYATNVMGSLNLLEAIRKVSCVHACVMVTTDKCYENKEWDWGYRECEPMGGFDPYSSSKGCMELLVASYRNSYFPAELHHQHGTAVATVRAGNVIGGGDWATDRLIPDMLKAFSNGKCTFIRNPQSIRPWQHVLEPLAGYLEIAECLYEQGSDYAEAWNLGPEQKDAKSVEWIANKLCDLWGQGASWQCDNSQSHPHEAHYLKLDCSKVWSRLKWRPQWTLEKALEQIVEWHKSVTGGLSARQITLQQILKYSQLIK